MKSITEKVLQYQRTHEGLREIVEELAPRVYQFPNRTMGWDEDACGDFYVFIHPRLLRLLDRFRDQGKPFESYLWTVLGWQLRNFARERKRRELAWRVSLRMNAPTDPEEPIVNLTGPETLSNAVECAQCIRSAADRRNFLFLALKCSRMIDEENARTVAAVVGMAPEALLDLASHLRKMRTSREERLDTFRRRRNKAFAQSQLLEAELQNEIEPCRREALSAALKKSRSRMRDAARRMSRVGLSPTNREIGAVLGVPKGTVDSGLFWLKKKLSSGYDPGLRFA